MVVHKRKKLSRQRGSKTHGWGAMKKHRGAGNRGGRGMAGTGKRADQMKSWIIKKYGSVNNYFGKHGFRIPQKVKQVDNPINIKDLPNKDEINLTDMGYTKLLSKGNINRKIKIIVKKCSKNAKDKIEKAGGQVIIQ